MILVILVVFYVDYLVGLSYYSLWGPLPERRGVSVIVWGGQGVHGVPPSPPPVYPQMGPYVLLSVPVRKHLSSRYTPGSRQVHGLVYARGMVVVVGVGVGGVGRGSPGGRVPVGVVYVVYPSIYRAPLKRYVVVPVGVVSYSVKRVPVLPELVPLGK